MPGGPVHSTSVFSGPRVIAPQALGRCIQVSGYCFCSRSLSAALITAVHCPSGGDSHGSRAGLGHRWLGVSFPRALSWCLRLSCTTWWSVCVLLPWAICVRMCVFVFVFTWGTARTMQIKGIKSVHDDKVLSLIHQKCAIQHRVKRRKLQTKEWVIAF